MGANLLTKLLALVLVLGPSSMAAAQTSSTDPPDGLQPSWSDSAMSEGWRAICGDVRNVGHLSARSVAIRIQGFDSAGQVLSSRERYLGAGVPAGSRGIFCVPMPAGAASYRVTVLHAEWAHLEAP
ncbi:MAG: hypothetical protein ACREK9_10285 [Candidatus Rokuibacteriota bacterium]